MGSHLATPAAAASAVTSAAAAAVPSGRLSPMAPASAGRSQAADDVCVAGACVCWGQGTSGSGLQEEEARQLGEAWSLVAEVR